MLDTLLPTADSIFPSSPKQKRGAVLRSASLSAAQRSEQARKAALARWARRRECEDVPFIRGKLNKLRGRRDELLAAVLNNAAAGAGGKPVLGKEELAALRAGLAELRMETPIVECRLAKLIADGGAAAVASSSPPDYSHPVTPPALYDPDAPRDYEIYED